MAVQERVRIRQAAALVGVSESTLRKWEERGLVPPAARNRAGQRVYDLAAIDALRRFAFPERAKEG